MEADNTILTTDNTIQGDQLLYTFGCNHWIDQIGILYPCIVVGGNVIYEYFYIQSIVAITMNYTKRTDA